MEQLNQEPLTFGRIVYHSGETFLRRLRRHCAHLGRGTGAFGDQSRNGLRVSGRGDRLHSRRVLVVLAPRNSDFYARRARRIASVGVELLVRLAGRSEDPGVEQKVLDEVLRDLGALGGRIAGEPNFLSGAEFFSLRNIVISRGWGR